MTNLADETSTQLAALDAVGERIKAERAENGPVPTVPCAVCGNPMRVLTPDQTTHPTCDPEGRH